MRSVFLIGLLIPWSFARNVERSSTLESLLEAIEIMQSSYFELWTGTWPSSIDWTAAVLGTHVSATLSTIVSSFDHQATSCASMLSWENTINKYFAQTSAFYFGENAFGLRNQAYDDMLWVVLGWLENVKFQNLHSELHRPSWHSHDTPHAQLWHGAQFSPAAAHRSRIFYEIASHGWDTSLCSGGMVWNPHLKPYKNAITNELFISASIAMYLYYPGDDIDSPFISSSTTSSIDIDSGINATRPHSPLYLHAAITAYKWLKSSGMTNTIGLYQDGFHIRGWQRTPNGTHPGTGECDELNTMLYTYNQGVVLSGLRGLWLATAASSYLEDGHSLIESVILATGWKHPSTGAWHGLGRHGVLEEYCDHRGDCSQNGHTFKGIFFHHLAEFCRPLWPGEEEYLAITQDASAAHAAWKEHLAKCAAYEPWIRHNANAALVTRDPDGRFGMWWGRPYRNYISDDDDKGAATPVDLPPLAVDYRNYYVATDGVYENETDATAFNLENEKPSIFSSAQRRLNDLQRPLNQHSLAQKSDSDNDRVRIRERDVNDRGRGRTVETQSGGLAVLRALWQWESAFVSPLGGRETDRDGEGRTDREDL